ncbi:conserved hypothetical protein [Candida tropicalis MYA-3404]|uniref:Protein FAF1 n=1 Tax=Candida tropicalis (strain ATCC MYA-3404 / T1) TaxID=294747 RepID=C5MDU9_CANTT|nr:conserved hypothetical protein [Candida tropicalis MYA-3404]EER32180.1 conserved hypothetical protein [Candida tropicalis MYA-3404]KAG4405779.1 hypothetical protein JTP64_004650 [Candida tropicalis]
MTNNSEDDEYLKALEIQRRNFEAQFGSIEDLGFTDKSKSTKSINESEDEESNSNSNSSDDEEDINISGSDSEEDGEEESISSSEEEEEELIKPKVVKLNSSSSSSSTISNISRIDKKLLKSGRAPTLEEITKKQHEANKQTNKQQQLSSSSKESSEDLENDLKLQRLLKESHILSNSLEYSGVNLTLETLNYEDPTGKARKRMLTSRIRDLSSINSTGLPKKLESMPMNMRKGMIKKRQERIEKFENDAKNAGIVLSKVKKGQLRDLNAGKGSTLSSDRIGTGKKVIKRVRDRGLKIHGIGKSTRNGLVFSQNDIDRINNKGKSGKNNNRRKRR